MGIFVPKNPQKIEFSRVFLTKFFLTLGVQGPYEDPLELAGGALMQTLREFYFKCYEKCFSLR